MKNEVYNNFLDDKIKIRKLSDTSLISFSFFSFNYDGIILLSIFCLLSLIFFLKIVRQLTKYINFPLV
jgi:hypothetical protein